MAIKTFKCNICEAEVTKPKSYAYKDGRACRHHPEAIKAYEDNEQLKQKDINSHKEHKSRNCSDDHYNHIFNIRNPHEYCWCCKKDGIYNHLLAERVLINMSKSALQGNLVNPFNPDSQHYALTREDIGDKIAIKQFPVYTSYPDWKLKQMFNNDDNKIMLARSTGIINLCQNCATKYEFDWIFDKPNFESSDLKMLATIGAAIVPVLDNIAAAELAADVTINAMKT
ncbi:MAG: hypothetical protein ACD_33C00002G0015 [uncultured bacterium]|nr:MAG: hypothetical protein ACD_33C00002G0015 [uncultured bacterium]